MRAVASVAHHGAASAPMAMPFVHPSTTARRPPGYMRNEVAGGRPDEQLAPIEAPRRARCPRGSRRARRRPRDLRSRRSRSAGRPGRDRTPRARHCCGPSGVNAPQPISATTLKMQAELLEAMAQAAAGPMPRLHRHQRRRVTTTTAAHTSFSRCGSGVTSASTNSNTSAVVIAAPTWHACGLPAQPGGELACRDHPAPRAARPPPRCHRSSGRRPPRPRRHDRAWATIAATSGTRRRALRSGPAR